MVSILPSARSEFRGYYDPMRRYSELLPFAFSGFVPKLQFRAVPQLSSISEVVITECLVLALDSSGVCCIYHRDSGHLHLRLNPPQQRIRTLYYNRPAQGLMAVFVLESEQVSRLHCQSYQLADLVQGHLQPQNHFLDEDLTHPGFIEFDDTNCKIVTRNGYTGVFKLWSMKDYSLCYAIDQHAAEEIRITKNLLLVIMSPQEAHLPLKLLNIETGRVLNTYVLDILSDRPIELVEQFHEFLLFKQSNSALHILNLLTLSHVQVDRFRTPQAFLFLPKEMIFIAIRGGVLETWGFDGRLLASVNTGNQLLTTVPLQHPIKIATCANQQIAVLAVKSQRLPFSRVDTNLPRATSEKPHSDLHFYDLRSGACVDQATSEEELPTVTTVHYDEETHEVFTGHSTGLVVQWSN